MTSVAIVVDGVPFDIEYRRIAGPDASPLIVFLHEGLGSVAMWKDFPDRLCAAGGYRGLVYSRPGYGTSTPRPHDVRWPVDFMHVQARQVLPAVLAALDLDSDPPWLFGHSDGASIALIHAAAYPVAGLVVLAPHIDVEDRGLRAISHVRDAYHDDLRDRLARYHDDVDSAFGGWAGIWLDPAFTTWTIRALLVDIHCPVLAIQGVDDPYGTMMQIDGIADAVPETVLLKLDACRHSPHVDRPDDVIDATIRFIDTHPRHARASTNVIPAEAGT